MVLLIEHRHRSEMHARLFRTYFVSWAILFLEEAKFIANQI